MIKINVKSNIIASIFNKKYYTRFCAKTIISEGFNMSFRRGWNPCVETIFLSLIVYERF